MKLTPPLAGLPMTYYVGLYVGISGVAKREVFQSATAPTPVTHGSVYGAVIGPFATKEGAKFMCRQGAYNPRGMNVKDAERLVKKYKGKPPGVPIFN